MRRHSRRARWLVALLMIMNLAALASEWESGYDRVGLPGWIHEPKFSEQGLPIGIWTQKDGIWRLVDHQGKPLTDLTFSEIRMQYPESLWAVGKDAQGWHLLDTVSGKDYGCYDDIDTPECWDAYLWVQRNGLSGLLKVPQMEVAMPLKFHDLGLEVYVAELGWVKERYPFVDEHQMTGYADAEGRWGLVDCHGNIICPAQFDGIHLDYGLWMDEHRLQAAADNHEIFGFARQGEDFVGYFDTQGRYHPLRAEKP